MDAKLIAVESLLESDGRGKMNLKMSQLRCFNDLSLSLSTKMSQLRCFIYLSIIVVIYKDFATTLLY